VSTLKDCLRFLGVLCLLFTLGQPIFSQKKKPNESAPGCNCKENRKACVMSTIEPKVKKACKDAYKLCLERCKQ
jgi:hypothetical protein